MTSPLSSASAASRAVRREPDYEPDEQWKANLKAQIQLNLASMVQDAETQRNENLLKFPDDSERVKREYTIALDNIGKMATETYKTELERERQERRWATGHDLPPDLAETMKKEQQAILDQIKSTKSPNPPSTDDTPTIVNTPESPNPVFRRSSTSSVSASTNTSSTPRLSKPPQRATKPNPPSDDETDEEESDPDVARNRRLKSQPITPSPRVRDDDTGRSRSSWEPGSLNLNRSPRPYSSNTPPKPSPEVWIPPEIASDRPQRRNSTASVRSTGSTASSRRHAVVDPIPETASITDNVDLVAAKVEQERARIQDADQQWRNMDSVREKQGGRRRTLDNVAGPSAANNVAPPNGQPGTSPTISNIVSSSPSQSRPPPPPLETKPIYRKTSTTFMQENPSQLYRKPSFVHEGGPRNFDKVPILPRSTQSHLSLSRPTEPAELSPHDSDNGTYAQTPPMSATLFYAQAQAEDYHSPYSISGSYVGSPSPLNNQDVGTRIRSRHPSNESRYMPPPTSAGPIPSYHGMHGPATQAYPSPPPTQRNTYFSPPPSRTYQQQPPYSASPFSSSQYSQSPVTYMPRPSDERDPASYEYQQMPWSENEPMPVPMSANPDTRSQRMRSPSGSQDTWRSWIPQNQHNLRSTMSNSSLRDPQIQDRYRPVPHYGGNNVDDPLEGSEEESGSATDPESEDFEQEPASSFSSNRRYSRTRSLPYPASKPKSNKEGKPPQKRGSMPEEVDEDSLEYQQMLAKQRKQKAKEAARAVEEESKAKKLKKEAEEEEARKQAKRMEEVRQREADRARALKEKEEEARRRKEEEEAELQRQREAREAEEELERSRKEEERRMEEQRREEERKKWEEEEKQRKEEEARRKREEDKRKRQEAEERRKREREEKKRREEEEARLRMIAEEEARLKQARLEQERMEKIREKEDEIRRQQDEIRKREEDLHKQMLEEKQKELERLAREARRKEAEAKEYERQARLREEEARKREAEIKERERQLQLAEMELRSRQKAAQEEALRRENERIAQEEERREQERLAQEEQERREEQERQKERERQEREAAELLREQMRQKEEQERIESEIAWKEHEKRKAEAARREEQAAINRKRQEAERQQAQEEAKRKRQQQEEDKKREAEKNAQQEEFRRREEEIRNRKRQETAAAWETWGMPNSAGKPPQSSPISPSVNSSNGTSASQRTSSASTASSAWNTRTTSASSAWSKTWSASSSASGASASASHASNPPSSASTSKPRSGSTGASGSTPMSSTPLTEEQWQRRNEEQFRAQQEQFRLEQERLEWERLAKSTKVKGKEDVIKTFENHARLWERLPEYTELRWDYFPWPMVNKPSSADDITYAAIHAYITSPHHPDKDKHQRDRVKEQIRRWHPDRFETKLLPKVIEEDKERVKEGAGTVVRHLNNLLTKSNLPNFFD
ncbi:hypothetical protein F5878DRAFT_556058 [Lentinula raphanica]|uniref:Uncharacterized protein n=1 Tax=Lentinula raphanica TaxID=153919 RepID=A0AA38PGK6_9AGAR|nr:hypothetical protein F5878DRAFT_556058 [Lentinula raphanica]